MMATKREPSRPAASRKVSIITSGSIVVPDFDATTNSEPSTGIARDGVRVGRVEHLQRPAEGAGEDQRRQARAAHAAEDGALAAVAGAGRPLRQLARAAVHLLAPPAASRSSARSRRRARGRRTRARRRPRTGGAAASAPSSSASAASACGRGRAEPREEVRHGPSPPARRRRRRRARCRARARPPCPAPRRRSGRGRRSCRRADEPLPAEGGAGLDARRGAVTAGGSTSSR